MCLIIISNKVYNVFTQNQYKTLAIITITSFIDNLPQKQVIFTYRWGIPRYRIYLNRYRC